MDSVGPALDILKCLSEPLARKIGYMKNLKENFEKLSEEAQKLLDRREDIIREMQDARKRPTSECKGWLSAVEGIENQWKGIKEEYRKDEKCLGGWCPHVSSRMDLGERVLKLMNRATGLMQNSEFKGGMLIDEPQTIIEMPASRIQAETSSHRTMQEILRCIRDVRIKVVGIWGMGGIGKTNVMKLLNNHQEIAETFEIVIWIEVSKEWTYKSLQNELAQRLFVTRDDSKLDNTVTQELFQKLKVKKFLLLLDDVWDCIEMEQVGVPICDEASSSKVVLSTRHLNVCRKMGTDKEIKVEVLSEDEAWALFREKAGEVVDSKKIGPLAKAVVQECCGLPVAIVEVGKALRKVTDFHVWSIVLRQMRSSEAFEIEDMDKKVFQPSKDSFDRLKNDNTRNCFLYCALYPKHHEIHKSELIEYWRSEGLIDGWATLVEAQDKGHMILKDLMDASLLEKCQRDEYVKMHGVIRDLAIRITSAKEEGCISLVRAGVELFEAPKAEQWEYARRISLMKTDLESLPNTPNCLMLTTLLLQGNNILRQIPLSFFENMQALRVLDLSDTKIESLPPSICSLVNLRGLYLNNCACLRAVPPQVEALTNLEVLHINGSHQVYVLPVEIGKLDSLRCLQLCICTPREDTTEGKQKMDIIPKGILPRLSQLEQVIIFLDVYIHEYWDECTRIVSEEMCFLNKLACVDLCFTKAEHLDHFVQESSSWKQKRLTSFRFSVGHYSGQVECRRTFDWEESNLEFLRLEGWNGILIWKGADSIPHVIKVILNHTDAFLLEGHVAIQKLSEFGVGNLNVLKEFAVVECEGIETIIDGDGVEDSDMLPNLEILYLHNLSNLRCICKGLMTLGRRCFTSLTHLELAKCNKLTKIFSWSLIQQLSKLECLSVKDCSTVKEIIVSKEEGNLNVSENRVVEDCKGIRTVVDGDGEEDSIVLPNLEKLHLKDLCNLESIWNMPLPLGRRCLTSLTRLELVNFPKLMTIFSWSVIQCLSNLENLSIRDCLMKEVIINEEEGEETCFDECVQILPKLKELDVAWNLDLVRICSKVLSRASWPSLENIRIHKCPKLRTLPHGIANAPNLLKIRCEINWWEALEWIDDAIKERLQHKLIVPY
ncbi:disease resistance protein At4g27190-like [Magnolia sinica]|uniref:disease resistance protein At4g27190-like n=1 Tax=Magnolia sinica TaxID=86752 RepID=UPI00265A9EC8|nr:disease resistance protein At4g27190-like [Magnolia sinica]